MYSPIIPATGNPSNNGMLPGNWGMPVSMSGNLLGQVPGVETFGAMPQMAGLNPTAFVPRAQGNAGFNPGMLGAGSGAAGAAGAGTGLGFNLGTGQLALSGLQTLGGLWAAFESRKMAKEQFAYTKQITDTNLSNQIRSYNTQLTDRANSRAVVNGQATSDRDRYIEENRARRGA